MEDNDTKQAYVEGRLRGLRELVSILKETLDSSDNPGSSVLLKSIVGHISREVESILEDFESRHGEHPLLEAAASQQTDMRKLATAHREPSIAEVKKQVDVADDLMKNLMAFKSQKGVGPDEDDVQGL